MVTSAALAFLAGILSSLSPCVLPLLPIVFGSAVGGSRWGIIALATGVAVSFTAVGLFVATIGFSLGFDGDFFRHVAAALMILIGTVLVVPQLGYWLAARGGPVSNWLQARFGGADGQGNTGRFATGLLLGAVWSPCVGPTLGAASVLAAQGKDLTQVALVMLAFGIGACVPLIGLGLLSREVFARWRGRLMSAGQGSKQALGALLLAFGLLIVTGYDKRLETALVAASPQWLTDLTTRF